MHKLLFLLRFLHNTIACTEACSAAVCLGRLCIYMKNNVQGTFVPNKNNKGFTHDRNKIKE